MSQNREGLTTGTRLLALTGVNRQFGLIVLQCRGSAGSRVPEIRDRNCVWLRGLGGWFGLRFLVEDDHVCTIRVDLLPLGNQFRMV